MSSALPPGWYTPEIKALTLPQLWRVAGGCTTFAVGVVFFKLLRLPTEPGVALRYPTRVRRVPREGLPAAAAAYFARLDEDARRLGLGPEGFTYLVSLRAKQAAAGAVWLARDGTLFLHALWADAPGHDRLAAVSLARSGARERARQLVTTNLPRELSDGTLSDVVRVERRADAGLVVARHRERTGDVRRLDLAAVEEAVRALNDDQLEELVEQGVHVRVDDAVARALPWPPPPLDEGLFDEPA